MNTEKKNTEGLTIEAHNAVEVAPAIPRATQRLQLHRGFPFAAAREQIPYLARLGVSHLYASPILTSRSGSMHGYDVVDCSTVNPELGGEEELRRLVAELRRHSMGLLLDIVPNHMAVGNHDNAWWLDVLEWGRDSRYAGFFDIDWDVADPLLRGRVLAPFLGQPYGETLASGDLKLCFDDNAGRFYAAYYDHHFPLSPESYGGLLREEGAALDGAAQLFRRQIGARGERHEGFAEARKVLAQVARTAPGAAAVQRILARHDASNGEGRQTLHRLLERQHYRLAWWRSAAEEINWRRFFDVIDLAGLRIQDNAVFESVHATIFRLYEEGLVDGLRIDHVDGLAYPRQYCRRLRQRLHRLASRRPAGVPPGPAYLLVEKILAPGEMLARDWHTDGTSGYVFMNQAGAVLHDAQGEAPLREIWAARSGRSGEFADEEQRARRRIPQELLAADFNACAHALHVLARRDPVTRDWPLGAIRRVLAELLVHFPVYRTYADTRGRSAADASIMRQVVSDARRTCRDGEAPLVDLVDGWLGGVAPLDAPAAERRDRLRAIARFQQLTSPVAAKSVEDTAFYRHGTLLSRNEVGADPGQFSMSSGQFHAACGERLARYPAAMLATATHDHKRGEDLRARLAVLSEMPQRWAEAVERWSGLAAPLKPTVDGIQGPDATDEYMLYQMLVGAWPLDLQPETSAALEELRERLAAWQRKAVREAKRRSGWIEPNLRYEEACDTFLQRLLDPRAAPGLLDGIWRFVQDIAAAGALNGLTQAALRLATPGVPDLYQGCEWWDFSLVDPDNRRPVDFAARAAALDQQQDLLPQWRDGRIKQHLIATLLDYRKQQPLLFARGRHVPLEIEGRASRHLLGFARVLDGGAALLVLAPRYPSGLLLQAGSLEITAQRWDDTCIRLPEALASRTWRRLLGGSGDITAADGRLLVSQALDGWPLQALVATN